MKRTTTPDFPLLFWSGVAIATRRLHLLLMFVSLGATPTKTP